MIRVKYLIALVVTGLAMSLLATTATVDGITWTYTVSNGEATVGGGSSSSPAIATSTSGAITVPTTLGGAPVTGIAQYAFYNCANLVKVVMPNGITHIDQYAFSGCGALEEITLPENLKTIGYRGFKYCYALRRVDVTSIASWCNIEFDSPASQPFCDGTADCMLYIDGIPQMEIVIPDGVKRLNNYAFRLYQKLTHISIPGSVTNIGTAAFLECSGLKSVTLPQIVCNSGFAATFPNSATSVTNIVISEGVTNICDSAFHDCTGLVKLVVPNSVKSIGSYAFQGCTNLVDITIPPDVNIGYKAFDGCPVEQSVVPASEQPVVSAPEIRNVTAWQRFPWNGKVDITFEVVGDVTAGLPEAYFAALSVSATDRTNSKKYVASEDSLSGDTGTAKGTHRVVWDLDAQGLVFKSDDVVFMVAYESKPFMYCIIDLSAGANATCYPVTYMASPPASGFNRSEYKTSKLVMRRIESGTFKMGGDSDVTLSKPFFCGVFEVTQKQYLLVMGSNPSKFSGDTLPVDSVSYGAIRGITNGSKWPSSSAVDDSSFMGILRMRTGINFDLPTEAQWEYVCRAGTTTAYYWGESSIKSYAWYLDNANSTTHVVGKKNPNAWGFYDICGNVSEWCLDWYGTLTYGTDPKGSSSGESRVCRGGNWDSQYFLCLSSWRDKLAPSGGYYKDIGFRIVMPLSE